MAHTQPCSTLSALANYCLLRIVLPHDRAHDNTHAWDMQLHKHDSCCRFAGGGSRGEGSQGG